ncbi:MAG: ankyrin repeat domain-containing protein [Kofleriaceae bacterium]
MTAPDDPADPAREAALVEATRRGDLAALWAAAPEVERDADAPLPGALGSALTLALRGGAVAFVRALLERGADPNRPTADGRAPLLLALERRDRVAALRVLLAFGADPDRRGPDGRAPLHVAARAADVPALRALVDGGADPDLCAATATEETPRSLAAASGHPEAEAALARAARAHRALRPGIALLDEVVGGGALVRRHRRYRVRMRLWLSGGEPVRWRHPPGVGGELDDDGATLTTALRIDRSSLIAGLFCGVEGMRVGGARRLKIAPHLAYRGHGVSDVIPPDALVIAEVAILEELDEADRGAS